jgi:tetratricopeptide (TPR) repeat protein
MFNPKSFICSLFLIAMAALGSSCAHAPQQSQLPQQPPREDVRVSSALNQAKAYLSSGNYKKALEIYAAACDGHPEDEELMDAYTDALESVKAKADKAYEDKNYAKAGELYNTLLKSGFRERHLQGEMSFDDDYLAMRISACSKMLMELGIRKYRTGDLQQAIAIWKKILVFNPSDREAKTSIDRATAQLQNLKQMK